MVKECIDKVDKRAKDLDNIHLFIQRILTAHLQRANYCARHQRYSIEWDKVPVLKEFTL